MKRNPLKNPKPGDVWRMTGATYKVSARTPKTVSLLIFDGYSVGRKLMRMGTFLRSFPQCLTTIIHIAEDSE